jgi:hypothetical protein
MADAESMFTKTFFEAVSSWGVVIALRELAKHGLSAHEAESKTRMRRFLSAPDAGRFVRLDTLGPADAQRLVSMAGEAQRQTARSAVDAASIVFAHTVLESALMGYLRVIALHAPKDWRRWLDKKTVSLKDALDVNAADLLRTKLSMHLKDLEKESIEIKVDCLHALCPPSPETVAELSYKYDPGLIDRFDKDRQDIVHRGGAMKAFPTIEFDLEYVRSTIFYFTALVNDRYDLKIVPDLLYPPPDSPSPSAPTP